MNFKDVLYKRLERYVKIDTQSDETSDTFPSTKKQFDLLKLLCGELKEIGAEDIVMDEYGYVSATVPATVKEKKPVIGFLAHVDTAPDASGKNVIPKLHRAWKGGDIIISEKDKVTLNEKNCRELGLCSGHDIVTASGDTLLGADDKAGAAIIMTAAEYLLKNKDIKHGKIRIGFTPDEEIGRGVDHFDVGKFAADYAYTVDGDLPGTCEMETFNADSIKIRIKGKNVHPGSAKGTMANSVRIAADIVASWPENHLPETTADRDGFIMFSEIKGETEQAELNGIAREHDLEKLKGMEKLLGAIIAEKRVKYPIAEIELTIKEQYRNMVEIIKRHPRLMENLKKAIREAGLDPLVKPVRGGTDGARLSFMGLPTPNIFTGGFNYHGRYEWISLDGMNKSAEVLINLAKNWAE